MDSHALMPGYRFVHVRDLLRELVVRDLKVKYKRSVLGAAWSLLSPLLHVGVFYFLFQIVLSLNIPRYSAFALSGFLAWSWFQSSLTQSAVAITANRDLIRLPGFRAAILPLVAVTTNMANYAIAIPVLAVFLAINGNGIGGGVLLLPVVVAVQYLFTIGIAYLVASTNVLFDDVHHILDVLLKLYMFMSPVFYGMEQVPQEYQAIYQWNPMVALLGAYRAILLHQTQPDWESLSVIAMVGALLLIIGKMVFEKLRDRFVDEL